MKLIRTACVAILLFALAGCSSTFAYRNLDWLVHWFVDDYIDLTTEQKRAFDQKMTVWLNWHKTEELPKYQQQLSMLKNQLQAGNMQATDWMAHFRTGRNHWERLRRHLAPDLSELAASVSNDQIDEFVEAVTKYIKEERGKYDDLSDEERMEKRIESMEDDLREYIGRLSDSQKQLVTTYAAKLQRNIYWRDYQARVLEEIEKLLREKAINPQFEQDVAALIIYPEQFRLPEHNQVSEHNKRVYAAYYADLMATLSPKQKKRLLKKIDDLIDDIEDMKSS
ncbi:DUF6279 family lipoprotein [Aestuariibacter sp. AA17]|uniref:DUF6279 family lipoprotein n=1 Tax=Fluctibacter corallii TaxID=2984329 RepID=A0ABT3A9E4_9ALTE|nr:DUF6279 family lipoprotein [Aestuariibacter sp. AA17]MCV2885253.1 DUF6279 family lipoprotein [Aestuariibacter sp. AA17]